MALRDVVVDGQRLVLERVPVDELDEWAEARGLAAVRALDLDEDANGDTWPPVILYGPSGRA